ncbi:hypothetical protein FKW77_002175 [Venturia effusa]|uniref:1-acyl-sn-glycerol-3-phosphate acyltransferase n=1 Tax=Venturia effusa TaxID=50376 RepID=A0A517L0V4_9PEZI|nr:hypothetical protein FKW77_002175 [Venturia effusa]
MAAPGLFVNFFNYVLVPYWTTIALLYILSWTLPPNLRRLPSFFARLAAAVGCLAFSALYGVITALCLRLVGMEGLTQWTTAKCFKLCMRLATGVGVEIAEGAEYLETRPAVYVGNHQSELDILFLGGFFPKWCSVTAKRSLKWAPLLGQFMWASKTLFIDRANSKTARAAFDSAAHEMKADRHSVFIFPEGTRSYYDHPDLLPFKKGAFHLAVQAQVPIVPVVCNNYSDVLCMKGGWKKWKFDSGTLRIRVLRPVDTKGLDKDSVDEIVGRVREDMLRVIKEMSAEAEKKAE